MSCVIHLDCILCVAIPGLSKMLLWTICRMVPLRSLCSNSSVANVIYIILRDIYSRREFVLCCTFRLNSMYISIPGLPVSYTRVCFM